MRPASESGGWRLRSAIDSPAGAGGRPVEALQALRGIRAIHAVRLVAELGDLTRFAGARHLMGVSQAGTLGGTPLVIGAARRYRKTGRLLGAPRAGGSRVGLPLRCARFRGHRPAPVRSVQVHHRSRLEGAAALVCALPPARGAWSESQQDHRRCRTRTLRLRLGTGPAGQTALSTATAKPAQRKGGLPHHSPHEPDRKRGAHAARRTLADTLLIGPRERASVTNNRLAANQRPNISLIDRRHSSARRVPSRVRSASHCRERRETARPIDGKKSHIGLIDRRHSSARRAFPLGFDPHHIAAKGGKPLALLTVTSHINVELTGAARLYRAASSD